MKELQIVNIKGIDCYEQDGIVYLRLEAVARGLDITKTDKKNGVEYKRMNRQGIQKWLYSFGILNSENDELPDFIPENIFYRLAMKARNETAEKFQAMVADEIIPSIRRHGAYMTEDTLRKALNSPDFLIRLATKLKDEQERNRALEGKLEELESSVRTMDRVIGELAPKANYVDIILKSSSTVLITQIAQDYGMSAKALNRKLAELRIQRRVGRQWILYAEYQGKGYVHSKTIDIVHSNGRPDVMMQTEWTQKGRLFLYEELKKHGIYPMIERAA
ncbi:phage antirepressor KilAC domain-containing protein [Otoolea muris]|uniref:phage antirepressor KilAC domain-containing protein n=1 Tax=Otoolea muris TaxID=2941515 RepID=UPI00203DE330|nr:phage antirepressor KilAC domain-containing protein [Otoolea muris]